MRNPFEIMKQVEEAYFLPRGAMTKTRYKSKMVREARHVAMYLCRKYTRLSVLEIADTFNVGVDTIRYAVVKINNTNDQDILELINTH